MEKLERLDLSANRLEEIDSHTFDGLVHLGLLDLSGNVKMKIAQQSAPFRHLTHLIDLSVCIGKETCFEQSFEDLFSVQRLQLHTDDSFVPERLHVVSIFEDMVNLRTLSLNSFKLIDVINDTMNYDYDSDPIARLVDQVHSLHLTFSAGSKKLSRVFQPTSSERARLRLFSNLQEVKLVGWCRNYHDNPTDISWRFFANLSQLRSVAIENIHQESKYLAPGLFESSESELSALSLKNMELKSIGSLTPCCYYLTELDLSTNELVTLDEGQFVGLGCLERLTLANNRLDHIPAGAFRGLDRLRELDVSINSLSQLDERVFVGMPALEKLNMSRNYASHFPPYIFASLTRLTHLDMSYSMGCVPILHADLFAQQTRLRHLNMKIPRMPCVYADTLFAALSSLETLAYSHNQKQASVDLFAPLASTLTELVFSHGRIGPDIGDGMLKHLVNLRKLHLIGEHVDELDVSALSHMTRLEYLHVTDFSAEFVLDITADGDAARLPTSLKHLHLSNIDVVCYTSDAQHTDLLEYSHPLLHFILE